MSSFFKPICTQRLLLRPVRSSDSAALVQRRNHAEVAAMQDWPMPYSTQAAEQVITALAAMDGPQDNQWWMLSIADSQDTVVYGDLALRLEWGGRTAVVGYTLAREHWGNGYATEALNALIDRLFEGEKVTRIGATLHPQNLRSAKVLERCGFDFEGHTRNSFWSDDENSDDWLYGLTPAIRQDWNNRPTGKPKHIELVEPHPNGLRHVLALQPHQSQKHFVSPITTSFAQIAVPPYEESDSGASTSPQRVQPWPRVISADEEPVGFVMLECPTQTNPEPYLWRLTIDRRHQGRGIGWQVLEMITDQVRNWGCDSLLVSWVEGYGSPSQFYRRFGFEPTGEVEHDETIGRLRLSARQ